jgi:hypothetical protein
VYSRITPKLNPDALSSMIMKTLAKHKLRYEAWVGYLCIHATHHFKSEHEKHAIIEQFVEKFRAAY